MKRSEILRRPRGLDDAGAAAWDSIAPDLWKAGLLTAETYTDVVWMVRVLQRVGELRQRGWMEVEDGPNPDSMEIDRLWDVLRWLSHRYGLSPLGAETLKASGQPGPLKTIPEELLDPPESGLESLTAEEKESLLDFVERMIGRIDPVELEP